jgi:hypothetical protein
MKKEKTKIGFFIALFAIAIVTSSMMVMAYRGSYGEKISEQDGDLCLEMNDAINEIDYRAWLEIKSRNGKSSRLINLITEENFPVFIESRSAFKEGDFERSSELRSSLGLNDGIGLKNGEGFGKLEGRGQMKKVMQSKNIGGR